MKYNCYELYNVLSKQYGDFFSFPSDEYAVKRVSEYFQRTGLDPKEYELCRCGQQDRDTGDITPQSPVRIAIPDVAPQMPVNK